jgi:hypothetical protein
MLLIPQESDSVSEVNTSSLQPNQETPARKPYVAPQLEVFGSMSSFTQFGSGPGDDGLGPGTGGTS